MDLDERMKMLVIEEDKDCSVGDTFAKRAEWYFHKRPQLHSLLRDLYNSYTILLQTKHRHAKTQTWDELVADLVMQNVEKDLIIQQLEEREKKAQESATKIELLEKLVEVLESERSVLMNENMRMGYNLRQVLEENHGLSSEVMFLRRQACELGRCVLKMREEHRVYVLARKIYEQLLSREKGSINEEISNDGKSVGATKWWAKVKNMAICGRD